MVQATEATLADLYRVEGKAELIDGQIVKMGATGFLPSLAAGEIYGSLREHALETEIGFAFTDNIGFEVNLPERTNVEIEIFGQNQSIVTTLKRRRSFSPDASFYIGDPPANLGKFIPNAPTFAAEVRSENDYGNSAELAIACKIVDYFEAGTLVVWDVDVLQEERILAYTVQDLKNPIVYSRGTIANAEPAIPGWQFPIDSLFRQQWLKRQL